MVPELARPKRAGSSLDLNALAHAAGLTALRPWIEFHGTVCPPPPETARPKQPDCWLETTQTIAPARRWGRPPRPASARWGSTSRCPPRLANASAVPARSPTFSINVINQVHRHASSSEFISVIKMNHGRSAIGDPLSPPGDPKSTAGSLEVHHHCLLNHCTAGTPPALSPPHPQDPSPQPRCRPPRRRMRPARCSPETTTRRATRCTTSRSATSWATSYSKPRSSTSRTATRSSRRWRRPRC